MLQGIVTSAIQFYVQGMVIKTTGPVFVTAFNPLRMIIVTALACIVLSEKLHLGRYLYFLYLYSKFKFFYGKLTLCDEFGVLLYQHYGRSCGGSWALPSCVGKI